MKKKYVWSRNKTDDIWYGGICDSIKECVEEAKSEDYEDTALFNSLVTFDSITSIII